MTHKNRLSLQPLQSGQVWELPGARVQIGQVGKMLVHYKHYKDKVHRAPTSLSAKKALEKFLKQNRAILVQE
jgi:hypothetical protein